MHGDQQGQARLLEGRHIAVSGYVQRLAHAPHSAQAYWTTRVQTTMDVEATLKPTKNLRDMGMELLRSKPSVLPLLRMSNCPPVAADRLIGNARGIVYVVALAWDQKHLDCTRRVLQV